MGYSMLADLLVAIHVGYVAFVVLGQLAIMMGGTLGWQWVRNCWFRLLHLLAILIVAFEAAANLPCPLTVWEDQLRRLAGQSAADGTFIGRCLHHLIFLDLPPWAFNALHLGFAALVVGTLFLIPPRWRNRPQPT